MVGSRGRKMPNTPMLKLIPANTTHMGLISLILAPQLAHGDAYIARYVWISMDLYEGFATRLVGC
ncbi:hypothetical protein HALO59_150403 [Halomonas sp. 59]|nr:hypothetical protein HALO59_150403 [Halomonas sp. 59]CAD5260054.1 hypothetical protein HALO113_160405 [Halomonas sp. 113]CAD5274046.1 hypothetical protein HALOI3_200404 [Halomonas sp. I3]CAD5288634.1 hypothetical protein HALO156_40237 [Halomonas sp. 156]VXB37416.1 hypothetical protein HALO98_160400 [Halomonas titanicae]